MLALLEDTHMVLQDLRVVELVEAQERLERMALRELMALTAHKVSQELEVMLLLATQTLTT
jgi:hypothetical protein